MTILIIGGAASGKSAYAENLLLRSSGTAPRIYIAAMEPYGAEAAARIAKHRQARAGKGFQTMERCRNLAALSIPPGSAVLLEDLGNLCANELYSPAQNGAGVEITDPRIAEETILQGIGHLRKQCRDLAIVSNDVFSGGSAYQGDTDRYLRLLGRLHRRIAEQADGVCEVVCGIPVYYKRAEPCRIRGEQLF